ncbi:FUSC family protein [Rhodococcus chondri]|uniref:Aromatic acid exporter family protein n=1 Tax=Rhodococcus chondri TaxID=3065941 RepID=A0ABU7JY76_9NOCA|nr:aromatic acid exporter family protein [Rhodococcus sp. CC-R104]MEE2034968.1 aromatic acid exporter family protein [Rhodococcus sp. CC-R104]
MAVIVDRIRDTATWVDRVFRFRGHERYVALQVVRCTVAAVVAWLITAEWLQFQQAFLAPYVAVFLVEATVLRSLRQAAIQVGAVVAGVLLAVAVTRLVTSSTVAIGVSVAVGYLLGRWSRFESNGIWVAITALLVIATGATGSPVLLGERLVETAIGAVVGVLVTAIVFPPVYPAGAETAALTAELRDLLRDMSSGCCGVTAAEHGRDSWVQRARGIDRLLHRAVDESRWAHESARFNPRPSAAHTREQAHRSDRTVDRLWYVSSSVESLAYAVETMTDDEGEPAELRERPRQAIGDLIAALADLVEHLGDDADDATGEADRLCERRLAELESVAAESTDPRVTAQLGAVLHPARRIIGAVR